MELIEKDKDTLLYTSRPLMRLIAFLAIGAGIFLAPFPLLAKLLEGREITSGDFMAGLAVFGFVVLLGIVFSGFFDEIEFRRDKDNKTAVKKTKGWYFFNKSVKHSLSEFCSVNIYICTDIEVRAPAGVKYRNVPMNDSTMSGRFVRNKITIYLKGKAPNNSFTIIPFEDFALIDKYKEIALKIANFTRLPVIADKNMDEYQVRKKLYNL